MLMRRLGNSLEMRFGAANRQKRRPARRDGAQMANLAFAASVGRVDIETVLVHVQPDVDTWR